MPKKRRVSKTSVNNTASLKNRFELAWRNFILFLVLFIISLLLTSVTSSDLLSNFFGISAMIFGFVSLALLIVIIILVITKPKKR